MGLLSKSKELGHADGNEELGTAGAERRCSSAERSTNASRVLVACAATAVLVGGCSKGIDGHPITSHAASPSATSGATDGATTAASTCTIYESGNDARVIVSASSDPTAECDTLSQDISAGGGFWTSQAQVAQGDISMVCIVTDSGFSAEVDDSGGQYDGQQMCSAFIQSGWSEDKSAEQMQTSASAAASASASQQQQHTEDTQAAQSALATLSSDADLSGDLSTLDDDVKTTDADLATTRADSAAGPGQDCENASSVVYNDAASIVYNDSVSILANDVATLAGDTQTVHSDISALQTALSQLTADGLQTLEGATGAIQAARNAILKAYSAANGYIDRVNADVTAAYSIANGLATGDCAGDGPGNPPPAVKHLG